MTFDAHANLASGIVSVAPSTPTGGLTMTVVPDSGVTVPAAPFTALVAPTGFSPTRVNAELVRVSVNASNVWTMTRAQEGTSARSIQAGDVVYIGGVTAKTLTDLEGAITAVSWRDRGTVQYSTAYSPGDVVLYYGERILTTAAFTTGSGSNGSGQPFISAANYVKITSRGAFWATDFGVVADGSTDDWTALQTLLLLIRSLTTNSNNGFKVMLPTAQIMLSKPLIQPTQTMLVGQGLYSTVLKIMPGANCDVHQFEIFNSAAQASILSSISGAPAQGSLRNAFRSGLRDLCIHGNALNQSPTGYYHGVNAQTNPLLTTGTGDPDFDPQNFCQNVQFRACSGDGFYSNGRSGMRLDHCVSWHNGGNGFTPSFDTQMTACQAAFNGVTGFYHNHQSNQGAANKSYNNGNAYWWTTGTTYAAGSYAATATGLYYTAAGIVASAVTPASDPTNWTACSGSTGGASSPQAWGVGVYVDSNSGEITMQCDSQQNSASNWYVRSTVGAVHLDGTSSQPNFGGANQNTSSNNSTNPNSYAHLTLDNAAGVVATLGVNGGLAATYVLRVINGTTNNDVRLAGDTATTFLSPDSSTLLGSTNHVVYNGVNKTVSQANYGNLFGDGSHGAAVLDGVATVGFAALTGGNTYTMNRDAFCTTLTINAGQTLIPSGYKIYCTGTLTNNGTIRADGVSATTFAGGVNTSGGTYRTFEVGGTGGTGNTGAGGAGADGGIGSNSGNGGTGSSGAAGLKGAGYAASFGWPREAQGVASGVFNAAGTVVAHKGQAGGGGGGGDGANRGGGGGAGASTIAIFAVAVVNTGTISAVGGSGFTPTVGNCGGGGGGAGGQVWLYTLSAWTNSGTTTLTGGAAGAGVGSGGAGVAGAAGTLTNYVLV